jgi:hypothetical protein
LSPYSRHGRNAFGGNVFQQDAKGIVFYRCRTSRQDNGLGFIVVVDQRRPETDFEFFDRQSREYWGTLHLLGISDTGDLGSTQLPLPVIDTHF